MELLQSIQAQIAAVRLPLYAVTVSAVPRPDTPLLLMLHWHGFRRDETKPHGTRRAVPGSALQINTSWRTLEEIDRALLDAAWQLGAWDLERRSARACSQVGASAREALECRQAFGNNPFAPNDDSHLLAEAPDRDELMHLAAARGYVRWLFRPVQGGLWRDSAEDDSLAPDGSRPPPCPVAPQAAGRRGTRIVYRLGRVSRIVI
ncbi:MAG: diguanylate cyclase [Pseudomonadota bacterium]